MENKHIQPTRWWTYFCCYVVLVLLHPLNLHLYCDREEFVSLEEKSGKYANGCLDSWKLIMYMLARFVYLWGSFAYSICGALQSVSICREFVRQVFEVSNFLACGVWREKKGYYYQETFRNLTIIKIHFWKLGSYFLKTGSSLRMLIIVCQYSIFIYIYH